MNVFLLNSASPGLIADQSAKDTTEDMLNNGMVFHGLNLAMRYVFRVVKDMYEAQIKDAMSLAPAGVLVADAQRLQRLADMSMAWEQPEPGLYIYKDPNLDVTYSIREVELFCSEWAVDKAINHPTAALARG